MHVWTTYSVLCPNLNTEVGAVHTVFAHQRSAKGATSKRRTGGCGQPDCCLRVQNYVNAKRHLQNFLQPTYDIGHGHHGLRGSLIRVGQTELIGNQHTVYTAILQSLQICRRQPHHSFYIPTESRISR